MSYYYFDTARHNQYLKRFIENKNVVKSSSMFAKSHRTYCNNTPYITTATATTTTAYNLIYKKNNVNLSRSFESNKVRCIGATIKQFEFIFYLLFYFMHHLIYFIRDEDEEKNKKKTKKEKKKLNHILCKRRKSEKSILSK